MQARTGDYADPASLRAALDGIERLLFVSSGELDGRVAQHRNVVEAAKAAGVKLVAYTSLLHADRSPLGLAEDHRQTEALLAASGLPTRAAAQRLVHRELHGEPARRPGPRRRAGRGRRRPHRVGRPRRLCRRGAAVLTSPEDQAGRTYELAGDAAYTLAELAAELSRQAGRPIAYKDLPHAEFEKVLLGAGLPPFLAALLADSDAGAAKGALFDEGGDLRRLIGRPTTPLATSVAAALKAA